MDHASTGIVKAFQSYSVTSSDGTVTGPSTYSYEFQVGSYRSTSGRYLNWKDRIANGLSATTTLTAGYRHLNISSSGIIRDQLGGGPTANEAATGGALWQYGNNLLPAAPVYSFNETLVSKADVQASENFVKSYQQAVTKFSSGVALGELRETLRFLKSPAKSLLDLSTGHFKQLSKDLRRLGNSKLGDKIDGRNSKILKMATDSHLAYAYAARPLVRDVQDAAKALAVLQNRNPNPSIRLIGTGSASETQLQGYTPQFRSPAGGGSKSHVLLRSVDDCTVRYVGAYMARQSPIGSTMETLGLTPENWLPTAWELVPGSFVLDYFGNVNKVLETASFQLVDLAWLQKTIRRHLVLTVSSMSHRSLVSGQADNSSQYNYSYGGGATDVHHLVHRAPAANIRVSPLRFEIPGLGQALNLASLTNSLTAFRR